MPGDQRVIVVMGQGSESGTPDRCVLHLALNVMAETVSDAFSRVAALANQVVDALHQRGVPEEDMQTQTVSLQDFFDQKEQKVTARVGTYAFQVSVPVGDVGPHLGAVADVAGDSLQVRGLMLTMSDPEPLLTIARRRAVEDARARAEQLAEAAQVRLGSILSIEEGGGRGLRLGPQKVSFTPMAASAVPVEPGSAWVNVFVTLTFGLED